MNLKFRSHNTTISDDLRDYTDKKLSRLARLLPRIDDVAIELTHEETRSAVHRYRVQITVHAANSVLRGDERAADPKSALDLATDVVVRQARRHQKRIHDRHRDGASKEYAAAIAATPAEPAAADAEHEEEYAGGHVVRTKRFDAKPMSEEEALAQMDLLGHDFFLFLDAATREFAVLYKRKDGDYGLLSPRRA